jgi:iron(III) transport system substrate-binding protein
MRTKLLAAISISTAAVCLAALAGCGSSSDQASAKNVTIDNPTLSKLYDQAKSEGSITWYTSGVPAEIDATVSGFEKTYPGIKVTAVRLATADLSTRFAGEEGAGATSADLVTETDPSFLHSAFTKKWLTPVTQTELPDLAGLSSDYFKDGLATTGMEIMGIGYNTNLVSHPPKTWADVLDSQYKGKEIVGDPRTLPAYLYWLKEMTDKVQPDFLTKLKANDPDYGPSATPNAQAVAAGNYSLVFPIPVSQVNPLKSQGAPIDVVVPPWPAGQLFYTALVGNAKHPNAAKLLFDYLFTQDGQGEFNGDGGTAVIKLDKLGTSIALPDQWQVPDLTLFANTTAKNQLLGQLGLS